MTHKEDEIRIELNGHAAPRTYVNGVLERTPGDLTPQERAQVAKIESDPRFIKMVQENAKSLEEVGQSLPPGFSQEFDRVRAEFNTVPKSSPPSKKQIDDLNKVIKTARDAMSKMGKSKFPYDYESENWLNNELGKHDINVRMTVLYDVLSRENEIVQKHLPKGVTTGDARKAGAVAMASAFIPDTVKASDFKVQPDSQAAHKTKTSPVNQSSPTADKPGDGPSLNWADGVGGLAIGAVGAMLFGGLSGMGLIVPLLLGAGGLFFGNDINKMIAGDSASPDHNNAPKQMASADSHVGHTGAYHDPERPQTPLRTASPSRSIS